MYLRQKVCRSTAGINCPKRPCFFWLLPYTIFQKAWQVGVTFGVLSSNSSPEVFIGAVGLALGIGLQNVPEGAALSIPIRTDGESRLKAFYWGSMTAILPYSLSFAAGAMIFVVVEELIPDSQTNGNTDVATLGLMVGFVLMMVLDVALR